MAGRARRPAARWRCASPRTTTACAASRCSGPGPTSTTGPASRAGSSSTPVTSGRSAHRASPRSSTSGPASSAASARSTPPGALAPRPLLVLHGDDDDYRAGRRRPPASPRPTAGPSCACIARRRPPAAPRPAGRGHPARLARPSALRRTGRPRRLDHAEPLGVAPGARRFVGEQVVELRRRRLWPRCSARRRWLRGRRRRSETACAGMRPPAPHGGEGAVNEVASKCWGLVTGIGEEGLVGDGTAARRRAQRRTLPGRCTGAPATALSRATR